MAADLAGTEVSGVRAQLCGDAHLANFGVFAAPDRRLVFDVNDFDETHAGPWEWDVKRLAASVEVAGRDRGLRGRERRDAVRGAARAYRKAMRSFAAMRAIDVWYSRLDEDEVASRVGGSRRKDLDKAVAKARRKDSLRALDRLTYDAGGEPRIISDPPLIVPIEDVAASEGAGRGAAADAGGERHHARLDERGRAGRPAPLLRPPALGRKGLGQYRDTPIRTSATTPRCARQPTAVGSRSPTRSE
jgi:hypothetical protein